jgi:NAD(P)-dependent dehydrogenase (short-subunit alcohol dehydrogenase family)
MISIDLSGKTILITGALGAIAEHMVRRLVASGAMLVLTDIKEEGKAKQILDDWKIPPSSYLYFAADITESSQVDRRGACSFRKVPGYGYGAWPRRRLRAASLRQHVGSRL